MERWWPAPAVAAPIPPVSGEGVVLRAPETALPLLPADIPTFDEPAAAIRQPQPRYPPALRLASIEGRVLVEFVIDTTGLIDPGSLRIVERTHQGFEAAALEALERSMFRPARVAGRPVRQRTLQSIAFRIRE